MQISVTPQGALKVFGWFLAGLFWLCLALGLIGLFSSSDRSGAGMVIMGLSVLAIMHWYVLLIPFGIFTWGMWNAAKTGRGGLVSAFKWLTIALALSACTVILLFAVIDVH